MMYRPNIPGHLHIFGPNLLQFFSTQKMHVSEYACKNGVRKNAPGKKTPGKMPPRKLPTGKLPLGNKPPSKIASRKIVSLDFCCF